LLFVLLLLGGSMVEVGFYRGSFRFKSTYNPEAGREGFQFEIDHNKIEPDVGTVQEKIGGGGIQSEEKPKGQHP